MAAEAQATDEKIPLWEFGLGVSLLSVLSHGWGTRFVADTAHIYPIPVPYFVYRGQFLRADRDGIRDVFFSRNVVEFNVSVNATTPVNSRNTPARGGMPNLKPTVEIGPSMEVHFWHSEERRVRLDLRMPLREAVTVENSPRSIGWFFAPRLNVDMVTLGRARAGILDYLRGRSSRVGATTSTGSVAIRKRLVCCAPD